MAGMPLLPCEEFKAIIHHECARCDRNGHEFSLVLIDLDQFNGNGKRYSNQSIRSIIRRMRMTDEMGWFDEKRLGIFLPETSNEGARTFMGEICEDNNCVIYTYPSSLPYEIERNNDNDRDKNISGRGSIDGNQYNTPHEGPEADVPFGSDIKTYIHHREQDSSLEEILLDRKLPFWKRSLDIIGSSVGLLILSPLFATVVAYIKIVSPGPVFFKHERIGYLGKPFTMWKFRTMKPTADSLVHQNHLKKLMANDVSMIKLDQGKDDRLIPLGWVLRKSCIDELPQLINVLKGDMSLIGPRPCLAYEADDFHRWQTRRFHSHPGMTGLWQVSGKNLTTFREMMRLDIRYAQKKNPFMDLMIFLKTAPVVIGEMTGKFTSRMAKSPAQWSPSAPSRFSLGSIVRNLFL